MTLEFVSQFPDWHHVLFKVKDADLSIRFYSEYLGLTAIVDQKDAEGARWVWMRFLENPHAPLYVFFEDSQWKKPEKAPETSFQRLNGDGPEVIVLNIVFSRPLHFDRQSWQHACEQCCFDDEVRL